MAQVQGQLGREMGDDAGEIVALLAEMRAQDPHLAEALRDYMMMFARRRLSVADGASALADQDALELLRRRSRGKQLELICRLAESLLAEPQRWTLPVRELEVLAEVHAADRRRYRRVVELLRGWIEQATRAA